MAKRRNRSRQRVNNLPTLETLLPDNEITLTPIRDTLSALVVEDRRQFDPLRDVARGALHRSARIVEAQPKQAPRQGRKTSRTAQTVQRFNVPKEVAICVRRKQRREVLFAKRRTGTGSHRRVRKYNQWSNISCR